MTTSKSGPSPLGRRVNTLRWRAGLSRDELAERANLSRHIVASIESGRRPNPTLRVLLGLATGLGVTPGELLDGVVDFPAPAG